MRKQESLFNVNRDLFEQICAEDNLLQAFLFVKKNKGAAGIDDITIEIFEARLLNNLSLISKELKLWRYKPRPVKSIEIPKPDGGVRKLGIPCVRDRVVQACIKMVLEPIFESKFSQSNYGFRPGIKQSDAIKQAQSYVTSGLEWVVDIDLSKFFDRISHDRLIYLMGKEISDKRILRLTGIILRSGAMTSDGLIHATQEGSVQGSPLSPLLSNIILDELDKELEKRESKFVRWADDCNIFFRNEKVAKRAMQSIKKFIEGKMKLVINEEKSKVAKSKDVKFLGVTVIENNIAIAAKSMKRAMEKIKELIPTNSPTPIQITLEKTNEWFRGWANYFAITNYPSQLLAIEAHIRRRLRARIVRQSKRRRTLYRKLVEKGMKKASAATISYSNKGPWRTSHSAIEKVFSNKWFIESMGQIVLSDRKLQHWFSVRTWIRLL